MVFLQQCPVCSSDKIKPFIRCVDHLVSKKEFDLYRCSNCGFILTQGHPGEPEIGSYYESENYISHDDTAKGLLNRIYLLARHLMLNRKKNIVEDACSREKGDLLDIGCGTGYFAGKMKDSGWKVTGIEPSTRAREFGASRFGLDVRKPEEISELPCKSFDCITLWHVLEHLHDPFKYSAEIKRLLKPGGYCITALPNSGSYDAGYYGTAWAAYDVPRHLWHFNPSTFRLFWEKAAFRIVGIKRLPLDVFYISILSRKNLGSKLPFISGVLIGSWFAIKSAFNKSRTSSLIFILKEEENQ